MLKMRKTKILITSTSFQDSPGRHHEILKKEDGMSISKEVH